jgi:hypothetical protein
MREHVGLLITLSAANNDPVPDSEMTTPRVRPTLPGPRIR